MHRPPAASHQLVRSRGHGFALLALVVVSLIPLLALGMNTPPVRGLIWSCFGLILLCATLSLHAWWKSPTGLLQWDGKQWFYREQESSHSCEVVLHWDFQRLLVVRVRTHDSSVLWFWLEPAGDMAQWLALRRALVAGASSSAVQDADDALSRNEAVPA